jgi:hypothetical protein
MKFKIGDEVRIIHGATLIDNRVLPSNMSGIRLYIRNVKDDCYTIGRATSGPVLGDIAESNLRFFEENEAMINPFIIQVLENDTPIYHSPSKTSGIIRRVDSSVLYMIVDERAGFGKLQMGAGWVELAKVKKFK